MKAEDIRELSDELLQARIEELKESIFRMRFKLSLGTLDVVKNLREQRKDLARVQTIIREREIAAGKQ